MATNLEWEDRKRLSKILRNLNQIVVKRKRSLVRQGFLQISFPKILQNYYGTISIIKIH